MADLHNDCFAYEAQRKYPIHTKEATLQSYDAYLQDMPYLSKDRCDLINRNFVKAASFHGIKLHSPIPDAPAPRPTVSFKDEDNTEVKLSKVASENDLSELVEKIDSSRDALSMPMIRKMALYAFKEGENMGAGEAVMIRLEKMAGLGTGDKEEMLNQFLKRASMVFLPESAKSAVYKAYRDMNSMDGSIMMKQAADMCDLLSGIDRLYDLTEHYGKELKAPEDVCHAITVDTLTKEASDFLHVDSTDTVLSKTALLERKDDVNAFLSDTFDYTPSTDDALLNKVASLEAPAIKALIEKLGE